MAPEKEVHFFDSHYEQGENWYRRRFSGARREEAVGEATQMYMYDSEAVERMAQLLPEARLIAILRNPVDRAYSHYWLMRSLGREPLEFEGALRAEAERLGQGDHQAKDWYSYLDRGRYLRQLLFVCSYYPRESVHIVIFEDLRNRPAETYRQVTGFLGVDSLFLPPNLGVPINRFLTFRSVRVREISKKLPEVLRRPIGRLNTRRDSYPPLDGTARSRLLEHFEPENRALGTWLGRDLEGWRR